MIANTVFNMMELEVDGRMLWVSRCIGVVGEVGGGRETAGEISGRRREAEVVVDGRVVVRGLKWGRRRLGESGRRVSVGWAEVGWWEAVEEAARRGKGVHGREGVARMVAGAEGAQQDR
jgi:hypothetical protein